MAIATTRALKSLMGKDQGHKALLWVETLYNTRGLIASQVSEPQATMASHHRHHHYYYYCFYYYYIQLCWSRDGN